jgi:hypothetical protein
MRLESVDAQHRDTVALLAGPLVLMRVDPGLNNAPISREHLLAVRRFSQRAHEWQASTPAGLFKLKPFLDIEAETYSAYQSVSPS